MKECTGRNQSEPSNLGWKTRQSLDLSGVTRGLNPQWIGTFHGENLGIDMDRLNNGGHMS
jgi:hypothetical protein